MGKLPGRVRRFTAYFGPIVNKILLIKMALLQLRNCRNPHFGMLMITELPQEARKPRLKMSEAAAKPMSDLPPQYRQHLEFGVKQYPPGIYVIPYVLSVATPCGNYMQPGLNAFEVNPFIDPRENLPRDKAALEALGSFWLNTLNDLAEGRRPDLFSAIKRKIKAQV